MSRLRIAAAQSISQPGDIAANIATHCRFIEAAAEARVNLLLFPELSLCGYELPLLAQNQMQPDDERLDPIRYLVRATGITTIIGLPLAAADGQGVHIGALILNPDGTSKRYCKQYLHHGEEERFAVPGPLTPFRFSMGEESITVAICADIMQAKHARAASANGATLYLASVLISESGYETDTTTLQRHTEHYGFATLLANHGGPSGGYASAGRSAFWSPDGTQVIAAPGTGNLLVVAEKQDEHWSGEVLAVEVRR